MIIMYHMSYKINRVNRINITLTLFLVTSFILTSCGNKGPLTLPEKQIDQAVDQQSTENSN